jgi:hypothetical protein
MSPHIQLQYLSILSLLLKREIGVFEIATKFENTSHRRYFEDR